MIEQPITIGFEYEGGFKFKDIKEKDSLLRNDATFKGDGSVYLSDDCSNCDGDCDDCSLKNDNDLEWMEYNSPVFKVKTLEEDSKDIISTLDKMFKRSHLDWNTTCGLHFHVGFGGKYYPALNSKQFYDFFTGKLKKEYPSTYKKRATNSYCRINFINSAGNRYSAINYQAYKSHKTLEFRIWDCCKPSEILERMQWTINIITEFLKIPLKIKRAIRISPQKTANIRNKSSYSVKLENLSLSKSDPTVEELQAKDEKYLLENNLKLINLTPNVQSINSDTQDQ